MRLRALVLVLLGTYPAEGFDLTSVDPAIVERLREAWRLAERGQSNREVAVLVSREPGGDYSAEIRRDAGGFQTVTYTVHPGVVAIFHTHPNRTPPLPSTQDRRNADLLGIPSFTLTSRGLWRYDPATREASLVMPHLSWLKPDNW